MTFPYGTGNVHDSDSIFEDVFVYGKFNYKFDDDNLTFKNVHITENLFVGGISTFIGTALFKDDVFIEGKLDIDFLTVRKDFDVGIGGTVFSADTTSTNVGIGTTAPIQKFQVGIDTGTFVVNNVGIVGIGTTNPGEGKYNESTWSQRNDSTQGDLKVDVDGSIAIRRNIYDSSGSPGANNYWLRRDELGIKWVALTPGFDEGIFIQDEGQFLPTDENHNTIGAAQSFTTMNFVQRNSFGIGTDTLRPTAADPTFPGTGLSTIFTNDLWGFNGSGANASIYRMTKVGINIDNPDRVLDVTGTLRATGAVTFNSTLDVDGATNLKSTLNVDGATTLNNILDVDGATTLNSTLDVDGSTTLNNTLDVDGATTLNNTLDVDGGTTLNNILDVDGATTLNSTLDVDGNTTFNSTLDATSTTNASVQIDGGVGIVKKLFVGGQTVIEDTTESTDKDTGALIVEGGVGIEKRLNVGGRVVVEDTTDSTDKDSGSLVVEGGVGIEKKVNIGGQTRIEDTTESTNKDSGALIIEGGVGVEKNLNVGNNVKIIGTLELENSIIDKLNSVGYNVSKSKNDYRLSSVGAGVSWRPSGVDTDNAIWVTVDGDDSNSGLLEGDAKRTVGAAASIAKGGDTIIIRSGTYVENNPIGLRTDVSVSGEDLRLVTIVPQNRTKDVFHVRRGCLIQNLNFSGPSNDGKGGVSYAHTDCGAVAFPPTQEAVDAGIDFQAVTGFTEIGPANEGISGRWRSPYIRNCTNFMTKSIGMKINGDYANANFTGSTDLGQDLKSMVCDSFTQYNENGIGVSLSNNAYAQLVSIFTIATDIGISCVTGGQCDLTNSNSSFGNVGLKADGIGGTEFTGQVFTNVAAENDSFPILDCKDSLGRFRKPFDGQGLFFKINLADYPDTTATGVLTEPMKLIRSIKIVDGGLPGDYNPAAPPIITIPNPLGPEAIRPEFSANVSAAGTITSVDVISSGRNFLPNQSFTVNVSGSGNAQLEVDTDPILFTVEVATEPTSVGLTTITFNEFVPYKVNAGVDIELRRISRIITSSHSFEYIGAGTDINKANPFQGGVPVPENEVIAINGGQVPFTSTDQKGNFKIGEGLVVDQTTSTVRGRDFNRAIQAQITPLILALR